MQFAVMLGWLLLNDDPAFNKGSYYAFTHNSTEAYKWLAQADKRDPNDSQNSSNLLRISLNLKEGGRELPDPTAQLSGL